MSGIAIFGTSGFAREVADICWEIGYEKICFLDHKSCVIDCIGGWEVLDERVAFDLGSRGFEFALGIGDPRTRKKVAEKFRSFSFPNLIHPSVTFGYGQKALLDISYGNILAAGVRMTNNIQIGNFNVLNLNVTVGHDAVLSDFITISPGANLSGNIFVESNVYVGTNSSIMQGDDHCPIILGESSVIGAGAFVRKSVEKATTVLGVPAKPIERR